MTSRLDCNPHHVGFGGRANRTPLRASLAAAWLAVGIASGVLLTIGAAQAQTPKVAATAVVAATPDTRFIDALDAYERNHWPEAYRQFVLLAEDGHADAARMALQMWRHGRTLYGRPFVASGEQLDRWARLWGCGADAAGRSCQLALQSP